MGHVAGTERAQRRLQPRPSAPVPSAPSQGMGRVECVVLGGLSLEKSRQASNLPGWDGAGGLRGSQGLVFLQRMWVRGQSSQWPQLPGWGQGRCQPRRGALSLGKLPRGFSLASSPRAGIYPEPFLLHPPLQIKCQICGLVPSLWLGSAYPLGIFPPGDEVLDPSSPPLGRIWLLSHLLPAGAAPALPLPRHNPWGTGSANLLWP